MTKPITQEAWIALSDEEGRSYEIARGISMLDEAWSSNMTEEDKKAIIEEFIFLAQSWGTESDEGWPEEAAPMAVIDQTFKKYGMAGWTIDNYIGD